MTNRINGLREQVAAEFSNPAILAGLVAALIFGAVVKIDPWWLDVAVSVAIFFGARKAWIYWQAKRETARVAWDDVL